MKPTEVLADAERVAADAIQLRRRIHRHPEIGLALPRTQAAVLEALDGLGLETRAGQRTTSVIARLTGGKPGPTILLRADMDALPLREATGLPFASEVDGAMHACGHDAHVAMLVGAARVLARRRAELAGSVLFMFQPGEEGYHGARVMLEEGLLDGTASPTGAFALHVTHREAAGVITTRPGPMLASGDTVQITVRGKGGHASAPHDCLDPIPVACEIVQAFQTLVTRRVNVFDPAVITIAKIEAARKEGLKISLTQSAATYCPAAFMAWPVGVCIQELADRIQNAEISVPTATISVAKKCSLWPTRSRPNSITPRKPASRKNAVSTS